MKINGLENMTGSDLRTELNQGAKFVIYQYCISVLIMTFKRRSNIYFIRAGESALPNGLGFTILSLLLGWWGIPWGPIYTIQALVTNFQGGKDVTQEVLASMASAGTTRA
ncbi:MAG: hypothetical protein JXB38_07410 [Anaerolineales bacterium]|nr:hypothetical protein [Anaerolineales bacterium]